jgi:hypothetical protein
MPGDALRTARVTMFSGCATASYVTVDAVRALAGTGEAERSGPGIIIAALSLAVMPFLSTAQRRAGHELGSATAVADSKQTLLPTSPPCWSAWSGRERCSELADSPRVSGTDRILSASGVASAGR